MPLLIGKGVPAPVVGEIWEIRHRLDQGPFRARIVSAIGDEYRVRCTTGWREEFELNSGHRFVRRVREATR